MARYRLLFGFAVLSVSLFVVSIETEAKVLSNRKNRDLKVGSLNHDMLARARTRVRRDSRTLSKLRSKTLRHLSSKACATIQELSGFGGCFGGCLRSWNLNYGTGTTCGAVCGLAATGNPVAIGVCAACVGTAEWIVAGCAMKCVWSSSFLEELVDGPVAKGRTHTRQIRAAV